MGGANISYFFNGVAFMFFAHASLKLLFKEKRSRIQTMLGFTLAFWTLLELKDIMLYFPSLKTEKLINFFTFIDGWAVAACSFFLLELISPKWINKKRIMILLSPYILFTFFYLCTFHHWILSLYFGFILIYSSIIIFIVAFAARRYQYYIHNNYSYSEHIDVAWLTRATVILGICLLIWLYTNISITGWGDAIYYLSSVVLWSFIFLKSNSQLSIPMPNNLKGNLFSKETIEEDEDKEGNSCNRIFQEELQRIMEEQHLYLNPRLSINDVANAIGTNRTYLSSYFNNELDTTFYDYINNLRIEKASKKLLETYPLTMNIDEIAERSGFNSTSTFRRAFMKNTGLSPLQYKRSRQ